MSTTAGFCRARAPKGLGGFYADSASLGIFTMLYAWDMQTPANIRMPGCPGASAPRVPPRRQRSMPFAAAICRLLQTIPPIDWLKLRTEPLRPDETGP